MNENSSGVVEDVDEDVDWDCLINFKANLDKPVNDESEDSTPDPTQGRSPSIPSDSDDESEASDVIAEWAQSDDPNEAELLW